MDERQCSRYRLAHTPCQPLKNEQRDQVVGAGRQERPKDRDPELVRSTYSGPVTRQAITVRLEIYRLESDWRWVLEVVN